MVLLNLIRFSHRWVNVCRYMYTNFESLGSKPPHLESSIQMVEMDGFVENMIDYLELTKNLHLTTPI